MFWSGNYIVRELKCLLKEENVTLTQVLEADDILQECKADNKALIQFLTRPEILSELITLITEEPPKNVELASQYRHANIASEVLTSNLSMLRDRLSMDAIQMNRLCDFVNKDPPLNPLLASYFSKTIEMLLERSPKQDWYSHHIVCLHVLDIFKSRQDFLPNLLRHISTSAISDTFKCFLHLGNPFNKIILEWIDEHQFLESLIQIICGTYDPEEVHSVPVTVTQASESTDVKVENQQNEKLDTNHNTEGEQSVCPQAAAGKSRTRLTDTNGETDETRDGSPTGSCLADEAAEREQRVRGVAAANAAALLCDIALDASSVDPFNNEWYAGRTVAARLRGEEAVRRLLQGVFTSPPRARRHALVHACRLLLALLSSPPAPPGAASPGNAASPPAADSLASCGAEADEESLAAAHGAVERAVAPHLPLLHHALLRDASAGGVGGAGGAGRVGAARVAVATLLARLALSEVDDVPTALISLGTAGVLVDMLFQFPHNNFLHGQVCALVRNARANRRFSHRYTAHLIEECNLLTRLLDAFEENEAKSPCEHRGTGDRGVRAGYMGHVVEALRALDEAPPVLSSALQQRWDAFRAEELRPLLKRHDTPLGGINPWANNMYEVGTTIQVSGHLDNMADSLEDSCYDFSEAAASSDEGAAQWERRAEPLEGLRDDDMERMQQSTKNYFLELVSQRSGFDDELWDDVEPTPHEAEAAPPALPLDSPWACSGGGEAGGGGEEGWAQFDAFAECAPTAEPFCPVRTEPFAPAHPDPFWGASASSAAAPEQHELERGMQELQVAGHEQQDKDALTILLAQKMLTAFHNMAPAFQLSEQESSASADVDEAAASSSGDR